MRATVRGPPSTRRIVTMQIGVPKEIKDHEDRVGLVPSSVAELVHHGHQVIVEAGAGLGSGLSDADYAAAGATLREGPEPIFALADMIVKSEGADAARAEAPETRTNPLHISASCGRPRADPGSPRQWRNVCCL